MKHKVDSLIYRRCIFLFKCAEQSLKYGLFIFGWISASVALPSDPNQVAYFSSDTISLNQQQGITIYGGHVHMQQGSTSLFADKVTVYKNQAGVTYQVIAIGNPAHYSNIPEDKAEPVDASGRSIVYYPLKKTAVIWGGGSVVQGKNSLKGEHIIYDTVKQILSSQPITSAQDQKSLIVLGPTNSSHP